MSSTPIYNHAGSAIETAVRVTARLHRARAELQRALGWVQELDAVLGNSEQCVPGCKAHLVEAWKQLERLNTDSLRVAAMIEAVNRRVIDGPEEEDDDGEVTAAPDDAATPITLVGSGVGEPRSSYSGPGGPEKSLPLVAIGPGGNYRELLRPCRRCHRVFSTTSGADLICRECELRAVDLHLDVAG